MYDLSKTHTASSVCVLLQSNYTTFMKKREANLLHLCVHISMNFKPRELSYKHKAGYLTLKYAQTF